MMDRELVSTENTTKLAHDIIMELDSHLQQQGDGHGRRLTELLASLFKGRSLVMSELNGALACSINLAEIGIPEHPTDEHRDQWRELIRLAEHVS